jgi:uncharacterized protein YhaN
MNDLAGKKEEAASELAGTDVTVAKLEEEWAALWKSVGVRPGGPDEGEEWLTSLAELKRTVADHRRRSVILDELDKELSANSSAIGGALVALGEQPTQGSLALLVEQADSFMAEARNAAEVRSGRLRELSQGEREKPRREEAVKTCQDAVDEWRVRWTESLGSVAMAGATSLAAGREMLKLLREYRAVQKEASSLRGRVEGIQADIDDFTVKVKDLMVEVAPDLDDLDSDRALAALKPRLDDALREGRLREDVESRLEEAEGLMVDAEQGLRDERAELERLRSEAGLDAAADLDAEVERAREYADCGSTVRELEQNLVQQSAMSIAELVAAVGDVQDAEVRLVTDLGDLRAEMEGQDQLLEDVNRQVGDTRTKLASLDHQGKASALEQDAELEFSVVAQHVSEYARVALAVEVLRRVMSDYGRRNQGPILEYASKNFGTLTDEAFDALVPDYTGDQQVLLARRVNGEYMHLSELSEGTVDQLYLALRLAGIEHHLSQAGASPPIVLDDILVNFDDDRASAALRLFADLGEHAQVLLFTHHRHIVKLAESVLDGDRLHVAELDARDHAAALESPVRPVPKASERRTARADGSTAREAILAVLRDSDVPLAKAEIIERAGMEGSEWSPAIRALVERGAVTRQGAKRGAKYSVVE